MLFRSVSFKFHQYRMGSTFNSFLNFLKPQGQTVSLEVLKKDESKKYEEGEERGEEGKRMITSSHYLDV